MSEMMERVAEALFAAFETDSGMELVALQGGRLELHGSVSKDALCRAVIEAMREPTEAMVGAAHSLSSYELIFPEHHYDEHDSDPATLRDEAPSLVWEAMIVAALNTT